MLFGHLLTGTAQIFADVRTYWSPDAIKRVTGWKPEGAAANGIIHLINSGAAAIDGTGKQRKDGKPVMKIGAIFEPPTGHILSFSHITAPKERPMAGKVFRAKAWLLVVCFHASIRVSPARNRSMKNLPIFKSALVPGGE